MRVTSKAVYTLAIAGLLVAGKAQAFGLGASLGSGTESWDYDTGGSEDRTANHFSFALGSSLANSRLFTYRLTLGGESNEPDGGGLNMSGFAMTHSFGFRIVRKDMFKLWVGPQLKFAYYDSLDVDGSSNKFDGAVVGWGLGPVFGFNLNFPKVVTLSFTGGARSMRYAGDYDIHSSSGVYLSNITFDADTTGTFLDVSLLFRFGEVDY